MISQVWAQGRTNDFGAPGLIDVMGPSHVGKDKVPSVTHVFTVDYDADKAFHNVCLAYYAIHTKVILDFIFTISSSDFEIIHKKF